jgi:hypothetical protein
MEIRSDIQDIVDGVPGGDGREWPGKWEMVRGMWGNRIARWTGWVKLWSERKVVERRVRRWVKGGRENGIMEVREEKGMECMVNEMQVLFENGWKHV